MFNFDLQFIIAGSIGFVSSKRKTQLCVSILNSFLFFLFHSTITQPFKSLNTPEKESILFFHLRRIFPGKPKFDLILRLTKSLSLT